MRPINDIQLTPEEWECLAASVERLPTSPVGRHLNDDEFTQYAMKTLAPEDLARIDEHLLSCDACCEETIFLLEEGAYWAAKDDLHRGPQDQVAAFGINGSADHQTPDQVTDDLLLRKTLEPAAGGLSKLPESEQWGLPIAAGVGALRPIPDNAQDRTQPIKARVGFAGHVRRLAMRLAAVSAAPRRGLVLQYSMALGFALCLASAAVVVSAILERHPNLARVTSDAGLTRDPSISPDGQLLAYAADRGGQGVLDIWVETVANAMRTRVTNGTANNYDPSVVGDWVVFRSDRGSGGIYKARITGGAEELVAPEGRGPRLSPDGRRVAYWVGTPFDELGAIFVVSIGGGAPVNICTACLNARYPVWSSDSRHLLFRAALKQADGRGGVVDWWVVAVGSEGQSVGEPVQTNARTLLDQERIQTKTVMPPPEAWAADGVLFTTGIHPSNAWKVRLDRDTFMASGPPIPVTFGTSDVTNLAMAPNGDIYFSSLETSANVVALPVDATARVLGPPVPLTSDAALNVYPSVSQDGLKLAFSSDRGKSRAIWVLDLATGEYRQVALSASSYDSPKISPDGSRVVYTVTDLQKRIWTLKEAATTHEAAPLILSATGNTGPPKGWSGNRVLVEDKSDPEYTTGGGIIDTGGGIIDAGTLRYCISRNPGYSLIPNSFSPDSKWVAFHTRDRLGRTLWITELQDGCWPDQSKWIRAISEPSNTDVEAQWSPDGSVLYFLSGRDGFRCIWAQRLDPLSKHPVGATIPVQHFHTPGMSLLPEEGPAVVGLSVLPQKLVFSVKTVRGNIWVAQLPKSGFSKWFNVS